MMYGPVLGDLGRLRRFFQPQLFKTNGELHGKELEASNGSGFMLRFILPSGCHKLSLVPKWSYRSQLVELIVDWWFPARV